MKRTLYIALFLGSLVVVTGCGLFTPDPTTGVSPFAKGIGVAAQQAQKDMTPSGLIAAAIAGLLATVGALGTVQVVKSKTKKTP